ncbi:MAG: F0F1 ATP synthase subunit A [Oscillospiraceae bacterium]|nr:F0F1 ATP synthase subunit A [Oscillospiraceae bacterium]
MNVSVTGPFIYFTIPIFGGINVTQTMLSSTLVAALLCCAFVWIGRRLKKRPDGVQVLVEKGIMMLYTMTEESMGKHNAPTWFPFICTLFLSSLLGSLIGMTGFLRSSTADVSTTLTWAVMVTVLIWYHNIKNNGFVGWLKGFTEPIVVMTPMNIVSEIAQPVSMAFRHFGNVAGGGVITGILYTALSLASSLIMNLISSSGIAIAIVLIAVGAALLGLYYKNRKAGSLIFGIVCAALGLLGLLEALNILTGVPILALGIPAVLSLYFDLFSGFVQALVFSLLSMVYISGALPEPAEAEI